MCDLVVSYEKISGVVRKLKPSSVPFLVIWGFRKERAGDKAGEMKAASCDFHGLGSTPTHP